MHKVISSLAVMATTAVTATAQTADPTEPVEILSTFISTGGEDLGIARLTDTDAGLLIQLDLQNMPPGQWVAFHIHEGGTCDVQADFESAGGHWNEDDNAHGFLADGGPHSGDMPNLHVQNDGRLIADVLNPSAALTGETGNVLGRTMIFHAEPDDYISQPSGDAGERLACALIE
jgi:Cu-Zn family superoxide dismutase